MAIQQGRSTPDPDQAEDLAEYIGMLGELRASAGMPSYRVLAKRVGPLVRPARVLPASTLVDVFKVGRRRLDLDLVLAVVRALGADEPQVDRWRAAYARIQRGTTSGGPAGVLRQLPGDLATFTGREDALARLLDAASAADRGGGGTVVVSAIEGMGGVGKTQLALHAAHELLRAGRYTDVQLYADLRGFDPERAPADPRDVLGGFLRALGVPAQHVPGGLDERAAMFRDRMHDREALVVLDNAADERQVRSLLPAGPACLVLITSRRTLADLDGAVVHHLDVFSRVEAVELLARLGGRERVAAEPDAASRVVEACGRLPLAVALAGARLRVRPAWSVDELARRLEHSALDALRVGGSSLESVFDLSLRGLEDAHRRLLLLLAEHPGEEFTAEMAAALTVVTPAEAERTLELLVDEQLVSSPRPGRYRFHDLIRAFVRRRAEALPAASREAALDRLLMWFFVTAEAASKFINPVVRVEPLPGPVIESPGFADYRAALEWYEVEWGNICSAIEAAAAKGRHEAVWKLTFVLVLYFTVCRRHDAWHRMAQLAITSAGILGDRLAVCRLLSGLGKSHILLGALDTARDHFKRALDLSRSLGEQRLQAQMLLNIGSTHSSQGEFTHAIACYDQALGICRELTTSDPRIAEVEAAALGNIGVAQFRLGRLDEALASHHLALDKHHLVGNRSNTTQVLENIADVQRLKGELTGALQTYRQALATRVELGDKHREADTRRDIGDVLHALGLTSDAREEWLQSLELYERLSYTELAEKISQRLASAAP